MLLKKCKVNFTRAIIYWLYSPTEGWRIMTDGRLLELDTPTMTDFVWVLRNGQWSTLKHHPKRFFHQFGQPILTVFTDTPCMPELNLMHLTEDLRCDINAFILQFTSLYSLNNDAKAYILALKSVVCWWRVHSLDRTHLSWSYCALIRLWL